MRGLGKEGFRLTGQVDVVKRLRSVLLRDDNVLLAYLFGSRARGFTTPLSDFDVAVLLKDDSLRRLSSLWSEIAKALGVSEDEVDLVEIKGATIHLKLSIVKNGLKLVDRGGYEEELRRELVDKYPEAKHLLDVSYREAAETLNCRLDKTLLKLRVQELLERLATLREEVLSRGLEEVVRSRVYRGLMERCMHVAVEAVLDICRHIVSARKLGVPETYRDVVDLLASSGYIPVSLAEKLGEYVGLRNILVHRYMSIDHAKLYAKASEMLKDLGEFVKHIQGLMEKKC